MLKEKRKNNRIIEVSLRLRELKSKTRELLLSEKGIMHRKKRIVDVEPVFGMIKQNKGFRRFYFKGIEKVNIELGLLFMAYNLRKIAGILTFLFFFKHILSLIDKFLLQNSFLMNYYFNQKTSLLKIRY